VTRWLPCDDVACEPSTAPVDGELDPRCADEPSFTRPIARAGDSGEIQVPITFGGGTLGVLRVGKKHGGALFTSDDMFLLRTIANQAALALAHARNYAELEERRQQQAAAWRGEREALVETVAAEIAHEVRYPINFFRSIFKRGSSGEKLDAEEVDIGCEEVERLERLVSGLRRVAIRKLERHLVPVTDLVTKAEMLLRDRLGERRLGVDIEGAPALRCDPDQATQILVNLLANALDAAGARGNVGVGWSSGASGAELVVWDDGDGFVGDVARVFAPWYTTKPRGTGLGLAITQRIVRAHGWTIEAGRQAGRTRFVIQIPAADASSMDGAAAGEADVA
jgi:signal transduction histidine kinase